jgi:hypothetical protein
MKDLIELQSVIIGATDDCTVYVHANRPITIELELAKQIVETARSLISVDSGSLAVIINMRKVAFITEEAREHIVNVGGGAKGITSIALVSDDHLANVISTLMIEHSDTDTLPMKKLNSVEEAMNWTRSISLLQTGVSVAI